MAIVEAREEAQVGGVPVRRVGRDEAADEVGEGDVVVRRREAADEGGGGGGMAGRLGLGPATGWFTVMRVLSAWGLGGLLGLGRYCRVVSAIPEVKLVRVARAGLAVGCAATT